MRIALQPTKEELVQIDRFETLRDAVRERYQATQQKRRGEDARIAAAMKRVEDGTHDVDESTKIMPAATTVSASTATIDDEKEALRKEIERMTRRLQEIDSRP